MNQNITGVVYDLDGTIINTDTLHENGWIYACQRLGITPTPKMLVDQKGLPGEAAARLMLPPEMYNFSQQFQDDKARYILEHLGDVTLMPGFDEAYEELAQRGRLPWIVTSAQKPFIDAVFEKMPSLKVFDDRIIHKGMYTRGKPAAEPLLLVMERMQRQPTEVVYVGDAHADYECAGNAGTRFIYFCPDETKRVEGIPAVVPTITDHRQLLNFL